MRFRFPYRSALAFFIMLGLSAFGSPVLVYAADAETPQISFEQQAMNATIPGDFVSYADPSKETAPAPVANDSIAGYSNSSNCPHWVVGTEVVWLAPCQSDRAVTFNTYVSSTPASSYTSGAAGLDGLYATPRIWLGYQGETWGAVVRYWRMSEGKGYVDLDTFPSANGYYANNFFKAETADVELTRKFCWRDTKNILSFGLRYAELAQTDSVSVTELVGSDIYSGAAFSRSEFSGVGPTIALTGWKPMDECGHLHFFYSARGSFLWDDDAFNGVETRASYVGSPAAAGINGAVASGAGDMFIGELQLGAQWNFELVRNRADAFFRFAFEYQYWDTNNTGAAISATTLTTASRNVLASAHSGDSQTSLVGFSVGTGFTW